MSADPDRRICVLCDRPFVSQIPSQTQCCRGCTCRAAELRRKGLEPRDPGYSRNRQKDDAVAHEIQLAIKALNRAMEKADRERLAHPELIPRLKEARGTLRVLRKAARERSLRARRGAAT